MKKMNHPIRSAVRGLVLGAIAFGASDVMAQPGPPARPQRPARPARPAPPLPPLPPLALDGIGDLDFKVDVDFNLVAPPLPPEPLAPPPPFWPTLEFGQNVRVVTPPAV